jgi:hypothetical protein
MRTVTPPGIDPLGAQRLTVASGSSSLESIHAVGRDQTPCEAYAQAGEIST